MGRPKKIKGKCRNMEQKCGKKASKRFLGLMVCVACYWRYHRHGDGKRYKAGRKPAWKA